MKAVKSTLGRLMPLRMQRVLSMSFIESTEVLLLNSTFPTNSRRATVAGRSLYALRSYRGGYGYSGGMYACGVSVGVG